jgi:hypothetical protein
LTATTTTVRAFVVSDPAMKKFAPMEATLDGQTVKIPPPPGVPVSGVGFEKVNGKWQVAGLDRNPPLRKLPGVTGPIDDAFTDEFLVISPSDKSWHEGAGTFTTARREQFVVLWDKWFRGTLPTKASDKLDGLELTRHLALFGDPQSNPAIAKVLPKLPIKWTKDELVVSGVKYDPATHVPVLIYPNPENPGRYVVINSGHTFGEADLRGTNALLYPRLGDWAVLKPTPTKENPAAFEVVAAGLFDENWQFPKK